MASTPVKLTEGNEAIMAKATMLSVMTPKKELAQVKDSDNLLKAFHKLQSYRLLSLPVYCPEKKRFFGFVDVADLVTFVVKIVSAYDNKQISWAKFLETEETFLNATCGSVSNMSNHNPYTQVTPNANISTAISLMSVFSCLHRVAVVGPYPNYELLGVVSQTDILRWLDQNLDKSDPIFSKTIKELNIGTSKVHSVEEDECVKAALIKLKRLNVSALAVVDKQGKLLGNFSMSDLRNQTNFDVDSLLNFSDMTCAQVIAKAKELAGGPYPVVVDPDTTLAQAIKAILDSKIHRVYMVDKADNKLLGVVSICDLLKLFAVNN